MKLKAITASLALTAGLVAVPTVSAEAVTPLPFAVGVHITSQADGTHDESLVPGYESWLGQQVKSVTVFGTRGTEQEFEQPNYAIDPATANGETVSISDEIVLSNGSPKETWANAANGNNVTSVSGVTFNQRQKNYGANLVAHGQPNAAIRLVTEFNTSSGGTEAVNDSNFADWVSAYRAAYTALKSVPGQNFTIGWDPSIDPGNGPDLTKYYPGDAYVDSINLDTYDAVVPYQQTWTGEQDQWDRRYNGYGPGAGLGLKHYLDFAVAHGKAVAIPELGLGWIYGGVNVPKDVPYFIQQMFTVLTTTPGLAVSYVNFWEDGPDSQNPPRGLYNNQSQTPQAGAKYKATFGSAPSSAIVPKSSTPPPPPTNSMGTTTVGSVTSNDGLGYLFGNVYTAPVTTTVPYFHIYVGGTGSVIPVLYKLKANGSPGAKLAQGAEIVNPGAASWKTSKVSNPRVVAGTKYYIGIYTKPNSGSINTRYDSDGAYTNYYAADASDYPTAPTTFPAASTAPSTRYSFYVDLTATATPQNASFASGTRKVNADGTVTVYDYHGTLSHHSSKAGYWWGPNFTFHVSTNCGIGYEIYWNVFDLARNTQLWYSYDEFREGYHKHSKFSKAQQLGYYELFIVDEISGNSGSCPYHVWVTEPV